MNTSAICIDASSVIHLVAFPDDTFIQDLWVRWGNGNQRIIAPQLLFYEVTNVLYRYQQQKLLGKETVQLALNAAFSLPIELHGDMELHHEARAIAAKFNMTAAYDAHYLAIAERYNAEFWTYDKRLVQKCNLDWVRLIPAE